MRCREECQIGSRPIDQHIKGFEQLGAKVSIHHGKIDAQAENLVGTHIYLDCPSVGATINIMMAACMAEGKTIIENRQGAGGLTRMAAEKFSDLQRAV